MRGAIVALTNGERDLLSHLEDRITAGGADDELLERYYSGAQRLEFLGLAVPPELRNFTTVVNWPGVTVDSLVERLEVKSFILPDAKEADKSLAEGWAANDLDSESPKTHVDSFVYGRAFVCLGANEDDREHPLITVESPREMVARVDPRKRRVDAALRLYGRKPNSERPLYGTLYLPDSTIWVEREDYGFWREVDRDKHRLGRVPVVPFPNKLRAGMWHGRSELTDVIPFTDAAARSLTNLQFASESMAVPARWALGISKGDFVGEDGKPLPAWEAYFGAIWASSNPDAKMGQFSAADLRNFHDTVKHYAALVSSVTGLPLHTLGFQTDNPPSAEGHRAVEARHVKRAELKQRAFGDQWARVMAYYTRLRTGSWPESSRIRTEWIDAATPTVAARTDAAVKLFQVQGISREGLWDELGWSEQRKIRERGYFEREMTDPTLQRLTEALERGANASDSDSAEGNE